MDYMPYCSQMMNLDQCASPLMQYQTDELESMYPDIYRVVYPKIRDICMREDVPGNPQMYPNPTRSAVERMTDEVYNAAVSEIGDPDAYFARGDDGRQFGVYGGYGYAPVGYAPYGYGPYGYGRRLLRDLVGILLIRSLLGRRGYFYY